MTSWASEESHIESQEYQDNANVRYQPFPESVSEKSDIQTNYDGYHCHQVQRDSDLSARFSLHCLHYLESRIDKVADLACAPRCPAIAEEETDSPSVSAATRFITAHSC